MFSVTRKPAPAGVSDRPCLTIIVCRLIADFVLTSVLVFMLPATAAELAALTPEQSQWLGERIYLNECNARRECLTSWNAGEDFPSLGIGHFIWFQAGQDSPFEETFPALMLFMQQAGFILPTVVTTNEFESPWQNREVFLQQQMSPAMDELRTFLDEHKAAQADFIITRFHQQFAGIITASGTTSADVLDKRVKALAATNPPQGLYALIDYLHFKGTGLSESERYEGHGWGLLQVLEGMQEGDDPMTGFVASARRILENRVRHAPPERDENRWLQGWFNRLDTYLIDPAAGQSNRN